MEERPHVGILNETGERVAKDNTTPKSITDEFLHDPGPVEYSRNSVSKPSHLHDGHSHRAL